MFHFYVKIKNCPLPQPEFHILSLLKSWSAQIFQKPSSDLKIHKGDM